MAIIPAWNTITSTSIPMLPKLQAEYDPSATIKTEGNIHTLTFNAPKFKGLEISLLISKEEKTLTITNDGELIAEETFNSSVSLKKMRRWLNQIN